MLYLEKAKSHIFELSLVALLVKTMCAGSTIADALVLISLVVSICYAKYYLGKQKADFTAEQVEKLEALDQKVRTITAAEALKRNLR